jgi:hypothetical protein
MLFTDPPIRYTPSNPYIEFPQYTKQQFDMRRKAEILKHKNPTQSNQLTKREKWALLINGRSQKNAYPDITLTQKNVDSYGKVSYETIIVKYPDSYTSSYDETTHSFKYQIQKNGRLCERDLLIPTPTSSSDVPGPIMNLIYDSNVPLYNYANNSNYGIINNTKTNMWKLISNNNTIVPNTVDTNVIYLYIQEGVDNAAYSFNIKIPIAIYVNAISKSRNKGNLSIETILNSTIVTVYYNDSIINNITELQYKINNQLISSSSNNNFSFDVSYNSSYQAVYYVGTLEISNLVLYTQPGYIYDIRIEPSIYSPITNSVNYNNLFNNTNSGIIFNYNPFSTDTTKNINSYYCTVNTTSPLLQNGIIITGTPYS